MTRLRFKTVNGLLTLTKAVTAGKDLLQVTINPADLEAAVVSLLTSQPIKLFKSEINLADLKKQTKVVLKDLGANFQDEVRPGRTLNQEQAS